MDNKNARKPFNPTRSSRSVPTGLAGQPDLSREREITYHVGWKTGKIHSDPRSHTHLNLHSLLDDDAANDRLAVKFLRLAWHQAPWLPRKAIWPLLWSTPILCFALTLAIVMLLKY
jgi:hypothetical protein